MPEDFSRRSILGLFASGVSLADISPAQRSNELSGPSLASDWPEFRGNKQNTGVKSSDVGPSDFPLELAWSFDGGSKIDNPNEYEEGYTYHRVITPSPSVVGGTVYAPVYQGGVFALDAKTGRDIWEYDMDSYGRLFSSPVVHRDSLYVGSTNQYAATIKIQSSSGTVSWTEGDNLDNSKESSPKYMQSDGSGFVIIGGSDEDGTGYHAYDSETGEKSFSIVPSVSSGLFSATSTPAHDSGYLYTSIDQGIGKFEINEGGARTVWENREVDHIISSPAIKNGSIYFGDDSGNIVSVDSDSGNIEWVKNPEQYNSWIVSSPAVDSDSLYIGVSGDESGTLYALDTEQGEVQWEKQGLRELISSPIVYDNTVFIGSKNGNVYALNKQNGGTRWQYDVGTPISSSPVIAGEYLFVTDNKGVVHAFGPKGSRAYTLIQRAKQARGYFGVKRSVSNFLGRDNLLRRAEQAYNQAKYEESERLARKSINKIETADDIITGTVVSSTGIASIVGGKKGFDRYKWHKVKQEYRDLISRSEDIFNSYPGETESLSNGIRTVDPSNYDSIEQAEEEINSVTNSLESISKINDKYREIENRLESVGNGEYENPLKNTIEDVQQSDFLQIGSYESEIKKSKKIVDGIEKKEKLLDDIEDDSGIVSKSHFYTAIERTDPYTKPDSAIEHTNKIRELRSCSIELNKIQQWNRRVPTEATKNKIIQELESTPDSIAIGKIRQEVEKHQRLRDRVKNIRDFLRSVDISQTDIVESEAQEKIQSAITEGDPEIIRELNNRIERISNTVWEPNDLFEYSPYQFERLVAQLWENYGYSTQVSSKSGDEGVDVYAKNGDEIVAIQVKQYTPGKSKVTPSTVREMASPLAKGNATHSVIVTSSTFTKNAVQEAQSYGERMKLIGQQGLLEMLTDSYIQPPRD
ncbi:Outer membrane protein assembly factor BamB, contains PQQ-like beta-propeller repeat [Halorientalis persicus]|uniref:Outer membrane protein assembly factor BamB, contains PQQ-like beta-propeller repeat n=1 Tax=Halorientalis persicus TaxID=1367881 RepID=A0A1H8EH62_9EURY|nr:PQQ-binding-like beta-propeller repeat protein [Halorientalis persicus]SEN18746.1 Outer membrane protein assembly factor BamB, contains PQQ-like beta-propeller repeat [Halorientalis persicus]